MATKQQKDALKKARCVRKARISGATLTAARTKCHVGVKTKKSQTQKKTTGAKLTADQRRAKTDAWLREQFDAHKAAYGTPGHRTPGQVMRAIKDDVIRREKLKRRSP